MPKVPQLGPAQVSGPMSGPSVSGISDPFAGASSGIASAGAMALRLMAQEEERADREQASSFQTRAISERARLLNNPDDGLLNLGGKPLFDIAPTAVENYKGWLKDRIQEMPSSQRSLAGPLAEREIAEFANSLNLHVSAERREFAAANYEAGQDALVDLGPGVALARGQAQVRTGDAPDKDVLGISFDWDNRDEGLIPVKRGNHWTLISRHGMSEDEIAEVEADGITGKGAFKDKAMGSFNSHAEATEHAEERRVTLERGGKEFYDAPAVERDLQKINENIVRYAADNPELLTDDQGRNVSAETWTLSQTMERRSAYHDNAVGHLLSTGEDAAAASYMKQYGVEMDADTREARQANVTGLVEDREIRDAVDQYGPPPQGDGEADWLRGRQPYFLKALGGDPDMAREAMARSNAMVNQEAAARAVEGEELLSSFFTFSLDAASQTGPHMPSASEQLYAATLKYPYEWKLLSPRQQESAVRLAKAQGETSAANRETLAVEEFHELQSLANSGQAEEQRAFVTRMNEMAAADAAWLGPDRMKKLHALKANSLIGVNNPAIQAVMTRRITEAAALLGNPLGPSRWWPGSAEILGITLGESSVAAGGEPTWKYEDKAKFYDIKRAMEAALEAESLHRERALSEREAEAVVNDFLSPLMAEEVLDPGFVFDSSSRAEAIDGWTMGEILFAHQSLGQKTVTEEELVRQLKALENVGDDEDDGFFSGINIQSVWGDS